MLHATSAIMSAAALPIPLSIKMAKLKLEDIVSRCGLTSERLHEECSREIVLEIATKLKDWKMVGNYLSMPSEKLKAIERENDTEDQRKVAMLDTWREREGAAASYWKLANALYQHGRRDLVEILCKAIHEPEESSQHINVLSAEADHTDSERGEDMPKIRQKGISVIIL